MAETKGKFTVVGIVTSVEYQKCKFFVQKLVKSFSKEYDPPVFRPMLNVAWKEYLWKIRRTIGGKVWTLEKNAVVFLNNEFIGDDVAIFNYVTTKARIRVTEDFFCLGILELREIFEKAIENKRKFAYFTMSIEDKCIGALLFLLYTDHVPRTVKHFLRRCKSEKRGWVGRPVHRLVKGSWLQMGGFDLVNRKMPCENYIVPHDRRGVLSTCNDHKHSDNTTQLVLSLDPTPWMDYKFVAFGQLVHGEEVLKKIEAIDTNYEAPKKAIMIMKCGEYTLDTSPDPATLLHVKTYLENVDPVTGFPRDILDPRDVPSDLSERRFRKGLYCHSLDMEPHPALNQWYLYYETPHLRHPHTYEDYFDYYQRKEVKEEITGEDRDIDELAIQIRHFLSEEVAGFQIEQMPTVPIKLEKMQRLDENAPSEVVDVVETILINSSQVVTKPEDPVIKHIIE